MTRFCRSCGTELGDDPGAFCPGCGASVSSERGDAPQPSPDSSRRWRWPLLGAVLASALAATAVLLLSGDDPSEPELPSPRELPANVVALVTHVPSSQGTLTRSDLRRAIRQEAAQAGEAVPGRSSKRYGELEEAALNTLTDAIWIAGQAQEMGISVTRAEVADEFRKLKADAFEDDAEYREFLNESRFTQADVDRRVETQMLSTQIQDRTSRNVPQPSKSEIEASAKFIRAYTNRWRSRTVCAPRLATERCSNGEKMDLGSAAGTSSPPP